MPLRVVINEDEIKFPAGEPKKKSGSVGYSGFVHRRYEYIWYCGKENGTGHKRYGTALANFDSGRDTKVIRTFIYNGMSTILPKIFENKINNKLISALFHFV